jgi:hypothetical protein
VTIVLGHEAPRWADHWIYRQTAVTRPRHRAQAIRSAPVQFTRQVRTSVVGSKGRLRKYVLLGNTRSPRRLPLLPSCRSTPTSLLVAVPTFSTLPLPFSALLCPPLPSSHVYGLMTPNYTSPILFYHHPGAFEVVQM